MRSLLIFPVHIKSVRRGIRFYVVPKYIRPYARERVALNTLEKVIKSRKLEKTISQKILLEFMDAQGFFSSESLTILENKLDQIYENRMYTHYRWQEM